MFELNPIEFVAIYAGYDSVEMLHKFLLPADGDCEPEILFAHIPDKYKIAIQISIGHKKNYIRYQTANNGFTYVIPNYQH